MTQSLRRTSVLVALLAVACNAMEEGDNRAAKRGAVGGALVGATMGAVTGDAGMAVRGAAVGAVTGGVAGSMADLENERENERTQTMADAIAGRPGAASSVETSRPTRWERIDDFIGEWNCSMWWLDAEGKRGTGTARFTGALVSSRSARLTLTGFDGADLDDTVDAAFTGHTDFSYDPDTSYQLVNEYSTTPEGQRWVGERLTGEERYSYYYVGVSTETQLGTVRSDNRIEMRFVGKDLIIVDTYTLRDGAEVQVQSYRLARVR
jgi:hypothetical protein